VATSQRAEVSQQRRAPEGFLATTPVIEVMEGNPRRVLPLVGFAWGFDAPNGTIELLAIARLTTSDWDAHLPVLRSSYPLWTFTEHTAL
jgi:hypothetical protein